MTGTNDETHGRQHGDQNHTPEEASRLVARAKGGDIRFCQMQDNALTVLTMLGLQNIFQVFQTEEEAAASYQ